MGNKYNKGMCGGRGCPVLMFCSHPSLSFKISTLCSMQGWEKLGVPWVQYEAAIHKDWLIRGWLSSKSGDMRGTSFFWKIHGECLGSCHEKAGVQHCIFSVRAMWCSLLSVTRDCMQILPSLRIALFSPSCLPGFHPPFRTLTSYQEGKEQLSTPSVLKNS